MTTTNKHTFLSELRWRGMLHDAMPGLEEQLEKEVTTGYVGFDPTADSLHIGNLVPILMLKHLQRFGHKPMGLVGGATGMVGDPSGKSAERNMLSEETIQHNLSCQRKQLEKFLEFNDSPTGAEIVNNYDWFKDIGFLEFLREVGKYITVNYMMAKDSVRRRIEGENGISFTEFSYQLLQGYDFYHLYKEKGVKLQMGASDQWGNIVTGTELIRRKAGGEAWAVTCPLITKSDGTKFGKTESGTVWLDPKKTSPYQFYQFWRNAADEDAKKWIRIFTFLTQEEIEAMEVEHDQAPHRAILQKALAKDVTARVHSEEDAQMAIEASEILFGKGTLEVLAKLTDEDFASIFAHLPQHKVGRDKIAEGIKIVDLLAVEAPVFPSKGEARKMVTGGGVGINKEKIASPDFTVTTDLLLRDKYLLISTGKKYSMLEVE